MPPSLVSLPGVRGHPRICRSPRVSWLLALVLCCLLAGCAPGIRPSQQAPSSGGGASGAAAAGQHASLVYVALGASDAFGLGTRDPDRENWPTVLASELEGDVHLVNLGIPGATVAQAQRDELPVALSVNPDIVTIWLGVDDLMDGVDVATFASQLQSLLYSLRSGTRARVFVGNLPDLSLLPAFAGQDPSGLRSEVAARNAVIASACSSSGAHLVDLAADSGELAQNPRYISDDGLHPSSAGAARIAGIFAEAIRTVAVP